MIRALAADDAEAVAGFLAAANKIDPAVGALSAEEWRRFVALPQNHGGRDFRLAMIEGAIAGVATPSLRDQATPWLRHFRIVVAPERRRRGIASALLRHLAEMDAPQPVSLQCLCPERWEAMAGFLESAGFAVLEHELDMAADATEAEAPAPRWEVSLRVADDPAALAGALAAIHNRAYAGTPSFVRLDGAEFAALLDRDALVLVAEQKGKPAGYCHMVLGPRESWIESLAVEPGRQRAGIGGTLVAAAMAEALRRAGPRVRLSVSDRNAAAYALYRRLGFAVVGTATRYRADCAAVLAALSARGR